MKVLGTPKPSLQWFKDDLEVGTNFIEVRNTQLLLAGFQQRPSGDQGRGGWRNWVVLGYVDIVIFPSFTETCLVGGNSFLTNSSFGDISQHQQDSILLFLQGSAFSLSGLFFPTPMQTNLKL